MVVEHNIEWSHQINLKDAEVLQYAVGYMDHLIKEAIEIWLHPINNR
jgi:hypothetical protein